jgi:hypothetical protein
MRNPRRHRGYILIVTLGALVLAATVMITMAQAAMDHAREARLAADDLQRRWGAISCRQAILPNAEHLLAERDARLHQPAPTMRAAVQLGRYAFHFVIADEQAKANVNQVLASTDRSNAEDRIHRALASTGTAAKLRLRPATIALAPTTQPLLLPVSGWGQVLETANPPQVVSLEVRPGASDLLTCWGDGRINIARASAAAIALGAPKLLQMDVQHLVQARTNRMNPQAGNSSENETGDAMHRVLFAAGVEPARASNLTLNTTCHSLWIITDDGRRLWYDLAVRDESNPDQPQVRLFTW